MSSSLEEMTLAGDILIYLQQSLGFLINVKNRYLTDFAVSRCEIKSQRNNLNSPTRQERQD